MLLASAGMDTGYYSIRMRAEVAGRHCSGAERIAAADELPTLAAELLARALGCGAAPDAVHCSVERLKGEIRRCRLPAIRTLEVADWPAGRACARALLLRAGVAAAAADAAIAGLAAGASPDRQVMRGAMIVDAVSGERLETDRSRGVRVSRMDLDPLARPLLLAALTAAGLGHPRTAEALVLAGKVLHAPGIVAELCWSDDPAYVTGYVADPLHGYQRITRLKADGDVLGGRALFVNTQAWAQETFGAYLEKQAVLFEALGPIEPPRRWEE